MWLEAPEFITIGPSVVDYEIQATGLLTWAMEAIDEEISYSHDTEESHCILPETKRIDWWDCQCIQFEQHEHSLVYHVE